MLLYLSPVLEEEDIPHKDKFREVILQLKQEAMTDIVTQLRVSHIDLLAHRRPYADELTGLTWSYFNDM